MCSLHVHYAIGKRQSERPEETVHNARHCWGYFAGLLYFHYFSQLLVVLGCAFVLYMAEFQPRATGFKHTVFIAACLLAAWRTLPPTLPSSILRFTSSLHLRLGRPWWRFPSTRCVFPELRYKDFMLAFYCIPYMFRYSI